MSGGKAAQMSERAARLEKMIEKRGGEIYSFCLYLTKNRDEADDLYQDIFVRAMRLDELPESEEELKKRLLGLGVSIWRDNKRRFARRRRVAEEKIIPEAEETATVDENLQEELVIAKERRRAVRAAVDGLPEKLRLPVLLRYTEDMELNEIAEILDIPEGTVKSRLFRAKKTLAAELDGLY